MVTPRAPADNLPWIDAARGIAILLVILVHTAQGVSPGGWLQKLAPMGAFGVQLFFVASAYTLCVSYSRRSGQSGARRQFFLRRIFRIAPMYLCGIAIHWVVASIYAAHGQETPTGPCEARFTPLNILLNATLLHALSPAANNAVVPGGWSIATEVAFYACFPWLATAIAFAGRTPAVLVAWTMGLGALMLGVATSAIVLDIPFGGFLYFSLLVQAPAFFCGFLLYHLLHLPRTALPESRRVRLLPWTCLAIAAAIILAGCWRLKIGTCSLASVSAACFPLLCGSMFLALCLHLRGFGFTSWAGKALCFVGRISFSLYVLHFLGAHDLARWYGPWLVDGLGRLTAFVVHVLLTLTASIAVAYLTYRWIEQPGIALGARLTRRLATA